MVRAVRLLEESTKRHEDDGFGCLRTEKGCLPLAAIDVDARITGLHTRVRVRQTFRNSLPEPLEATYIFPLPDRAAVTSFRMRVADRVVESELKERSQAREEYARAIREGHRASLAEEDRSGTFTIRVGNIPPQEDIHVELTLVGPLSVTAGEAEFRFPLVVAPRYVPGLPLDGPSVGDGWALDTDQVPDASRVTPPVLLPGFPNPVRLALNVTVDPAGLRMESAEPASVFQSSLHSVIVDEGPPWKIRLQPGERVNRDFILRFPVARAAMQSALHEAPDEDGQGTFALTIVPPALSPAASPRPRDVVVVLDRSGSMGGWKMVAARRAVGRLVDSLLDQDRFSVLAFDNTIECVPAPQSPLEQGGESPQAAPGKLLAAHDRERFRAIEWLGRIEARGGTEMEPALMRAMELLADTPAERESIVVLVTDGQVANEDMILKSLRRPLASVRMHTLGIDRAVNAGFLNRLADMGRGSCDLVESEDRLDEAMDQIHRTIGAAALSELDLQFTGGMLVEDSLAPARLPDVFVDKPVTIFGRYRGRTSDFRGVVRGLDAAGQPWEQALSPQTVSADVLKPLWGRARIRDLEDRYAAGMDPRLTELAAQIVEISCACHVLSRFTAYVAIDRAEVVNRGGEARQVIQPVESPDGWDMLDREQDYLTSYNFIPGTQPFVAGKTRWSAAERVVSMIRGSSLGLSGRRIVRSRPDAIGDDAMGDTEMTAVLQKLRFQLKLVSTKMPGWGTRRRQKWLQALSMLLGKLAELCAANRSQASHAAACELLATEASQLPEEAVGGDKLALSDERLGELAERVKTILDSLQTPGVDAPSAPQAPREKFWT